MARSPATTSGRGGRRTTSNNAGRGSGASTGSPSGRPVDARVHGPPAPAAPPRRNGPQNQNRSFRDVMRNQLAHVTQHIPFQHHIPHHPPGGGALVPAAAPANIPFPGEVRTGGPTQELVFNTIREARETHVESRSNRTTDTYSQFIPRWEKWCAAVDGDVLDGVLIEGKGDQPYSLAVTQFKTVKFMASHGLKRPSKTDPSGGPRMYKSVTSDLNAIVDLWNAQRSLFRLLVLHR